MIKSAIVRFNPNTENSKSGWPGRTVVIPQLWLVITAPARTSPTTFPRFSICMTRANTSAAEAESLSTNTTTVRFDRKRPQLTGNYILVDRLAFIGIIEFCFPAFPGFEFLFFLGFEGRLDLDVPGRIVGSEDEEF